MKLTSILLGQAVRLIKINYPIGGIHMPKAVKALQERYEFVRVPTTVAEYDPSKGVIFNHGKFTIKRSSEPNEIVINNMEVYNDGLVVSTTAYAEDADLFMDDVIEWVCKTFGSKIDTNLPIHKTYTSQIEFRSDVSLNAYFPQAPKFGKQITDLLESYGQRPQPFELSSFTLYLDLEQMKIPIPSTFTISRRDKMPFSSNLYFSSAPLKTSDHLALLEELEGIVSKK